MLCTVLPLIHGSNYAISHTLRPTQFHPLFKGFFIITGLLHSLPRYCMPRLDAPASSVFAPLWIRSLDLYCREYGWNSCSCHFPQVELGTIYDLSVGGRIVIRICFTISISIVSFTLLLLNFKIFFLKVI